MTDAEIVELAARRVGDRLSGGGHSREDRLIGAALKSFADEIYTLCIERGVKEVIEKK